MGVVLHSEAITQKQLIVVEPPVVYSGSLASLDGSDRADPHEGGPPVGQVEHFELAVWVERVV